MRIFAVVAISITIATGAFAAPPVIMDDRLIIELAAQEPEIVTPTYLRV